MRGGGGEGREGEKKKGTWLRDEERDRWIKERDGRAAKARGEKGGKAVPKRKRGKERERERPTPCTCVTVRPRTRRRVLISQRAPRRRASFCEPCFFRRSERRGATDGGCTPFVGGGWVEKSMVEAAGEREGGGGGREGGGGEGGMQGVPRPSPTD